MKPIIALLTDFGTKGQHYVAAMKAVILNINSLVNIIDISHQISPFSILEASYVLKTTYKYFPEKTFFVVVVDPGVGSSREIIALKTSSNYFFIGPNNGIFRNVFDTSKISECVMVNNIDFFNHPISPTFHGRDIMAPVAAYITRDKHITLNDVGPNYNYNDLIKLPSNYTIYEEKRSVRCSIQYIDSFGNGTTTIPFIGNKIENSEFSLKEGSKISLIHEKEIYEGIFSTHFSGVPLDSLLFLIGSTGFLEISINQENASKKLGFKVGDIITIRL
ncbi:MAG: SAM hydrolase/SAM-dependent halogenase family protein [Promethearchaeota archaeon]|jgi:S-adenosylmethionine hydrolase